MDFYVTIIVLMLAAIAWIVFIKYITFNTKWIYFLFFLAYIFSLLPTIVMGIQQYQLGMFGNFFTYLSTNFWSIFLLNYGLLILFGVLGIGLLVIKLIPVSIAHYRKRTKEQAPPKAYAIQPFGRGDECEGSSEDKEMMSFLIIYYTLKKFFKNFVQKFKNKENENGSPEKVQKVHPKRFSWE